MIERREITKTHRCPIKVTFKPKVILTYDRNGEYYEKKVMQPQENIQILNEVHYACGYVYNWAITIMEEIERNRNTVNDELNHRDPLYVDELNRKEEEIKNCGDRSKREKLIVLKKEWKRERFAQKAEELGLIVKQHNYESLNLLLTKLKEKNKWLNFSPSHSLQMAIQNASTAVKKCISNRVDGKASDFPKRKKEISHSIYLPKGRFKLEIDDGSKRGYITIMFASRGDKIGLPIHRKICKIRFYVNPKTNIDPESISCVTISRSKNEYYLMIQTRCKKDVTVVGGGKIGVDIGAKKDHSNTIVVGNGVNEVKRFNIPCSVDSVNSDVISKQKEIDALLKINGDNRHSNKYIRLKRQLNKLNNHIQGIRRNFIEHATKEISTMGEKIYIEKLDIKKMTRSASGTVESPGVDVQKTSDRNRQFLNVCPGLILARLKQKSHENGSYIYDYNAAYSSQKCSNRKTNECSNIATIKKETKEGVTRRNGNKFSCPHCGYKADADLNGANNHVIDGEVCGERIVTEDYVPKNKAKKTIVSNQENVEKIAVVSVVE